jgi:hypothetical protein
MPVEFDNFHAALQALKDAWLARDLDNVGPRWKAALDAARAVQDWRLSDSRRQDSADRKRHTSAAKRRTSAREIERDVLKHPGWPRELLAASLGERIAGPLAAYVAKLEDPAYAG